MRRVFVHLSVSLLTFIVGVLVSTLWLSCPKRSTAEPVSRETEVLTTASNLTSFGPTGCNLTVPETPEEKAVRLAVEFVARNGYTDLPPNRSNLSHETVETADGIEGMLLDRFDMLEPRAYGFAYGRSGGSGYTVVFRYTNRMGDYSKEVGRAVTMDTDFQNLRVEHKDFFLRKVHKTFR
jgi:hypothetical protein